MALRQSQAISQNNNNNFLGDSQAMHDTSNTFMQQQSLFARQSQPLADYRIGLKRNKSSRENSHSQELTGSKSVPAINRKKDTIGNFKSKLDRLEKNKQELENKMKLFD